MLDWETDGEIMVYYLSSVPLLFELLNRKDKSSGRYIERSMINL